MLASPADIRNMLTTHQYFVLGYGSLLSADSRARFSDIHCKALPVTIEGWQRAWVTRSDEEQQTYVGAFPEANAYLNATVIPMKEFSADFKKREQDYQFSPVNLEQIEFQSIDQAEVCDGLIQGRQFFICHTLKQRAAEPAFPVYQSYLDTCLSGCLEVGGEPFAKAFLQDTALLSEHWVNDRQVRSYPRSAEVEAKQQAYIDKILAQMGLLAHRKTSGLM